MMYTEEQLTEIILKAIKPLQEQLTAVKETTVRLEAIQKELEEKEQIKKLEKYYDEIV